LRGEYELTEPIRELANIRQRVKALELPREWVDVRDPEVLVTPNQTP